MKKDNFTYIEDIISFLEDIESHVGVMDLDQFGDDIKTQDAVIRKLELIGEAAGKIEPSWLKNYPDFPRRDVIDLRNLLIHGYDMIDIVKVWNIVKGELPGLKRVVLGMLGK
mgnify:CR=1 FL=1